MAAAERTRVGILGGGSRELELMLDLYGVPEVLLTGIYDPDSLSPALALAEILGIPYGSDEDALQRLATSTVVVLPSDRRALEEAVRWAGGLRAELVSIAEARHRWTAAPAAPAPAPATSAAAAENSAATERLLQDAVDVSTRLQDRSVLADWVLGLAMRVVGANGGSIQLLASDTSELFMVAARGLSERLVRLGRHRVGEGISGKVASTREPQILLGAKPGRVARERGEIHASISMPLEDANGLVGVLNVSSTSVTKSFGPAHLQTLERLGPRIARLLRAADHDPASEPRLDLPLLVRRFEAERLGLEARLVLLCNHLREVLSADGVHLYLSTEDGAWLRVRPPGEPAGTEVPGVRRSALDTALLEKRWLHQPAPAESGPVDPIGSAVERALDGGTPVRSHVYVPLAEMEPLGVVFLEFSSLQGAEQAMRHGGMAVEQLAFAIEAQLREHRDRERVERLAELSRGLRRLLDLPPGEALDTTLAEICAALVRGRRSLVRRVDERRRTYSRPVAFGIPAEVFDRWRSVDARITEQTLQVRQAILSTTTDESDTETPAPRRCSLLSVPLFHGEHIVGLVNVFEKQPRDPLDSATFTRFDRELLEGFALVVARLLSDAPPLPLVAPLAPVTASPPGAAASRPAAVVVYGEPSMRKSTVAAPAPVATTKPAGRAALAAELEHAAAERREVGLWVLRFAGLGNLGGRSDAARALLSATVRAGLRGGDQSAWTSAEELVILGPAPRPGEGAVADRLIDALRPQLARLGRELPAGVELRIGQSAFPQDGLDVDGLLAAAASRAQ